VSKVGFILRPDRQDPGPLFGQLVTWLEKRGDEAFVIEEDGLAPPGAQVVAESALGSCIDIGIVLGGDGTMLRASSLVADDGVPVLGINLGSLGFLSPFDPSEAQRALEDALAGGLRIEERLRMCVTLTLSDGSTLTRNGLNEAVIHQGARARLVELEARVDGQLITAYRADGLIVATPTGSTAYSLAAGGPILMPGLGAFSITPICAHALTNRPLAVSQETTVSIQIPRLSLSHDVMLTVDGAWVQPFKTGDRVEIRAADRPFRVFVSHKPYFDLLREKLHWGVRHE